ncbi:MAG TPA: hypothetical protein VIK33_14220 [Anaerolineae bacterium]
MPSLDSVVGELHIVNGQRQSVPSFTGAFTAPRRCARGRQDDALFVLVEGSGSAPLATDLIQRIQQRYWQTPGSVTAGLRIAIEAGNDWLIERNLSAPAAARMGVSCAVLRGSEAFIAQAGPSCAYVAHQGKLERFPHGDGSSIGLPPLGIARAVETRFSHAELHPGDVLLLADTSLAARVPEEAVASAIVYVGVEAALNNLEHLIGSENLIALVAEVTATVPAPQPVQPAPTTPHPAPAPTRSVEPAVPSRTQPQLPPAPKVGQWAKAIGQGVSRGAESIGSTARTLLQRTLPDRPAPATRQARRRGASLEQHTTLMAAIVIGIPILAAIFVTAMYLQRSTAAQVDTLLRDAQALLAGTDSTLSLDARRERWTAALTKANEALTLQPDNLAALDVRTQAQARLDRLDNTQRVTPVRLYDFQKVGRHRLAAQGVTLFVMDQADGIVFRLTLNSAANGIEGTQPEMTLTRGFNIDERVVSDLIDMVWVEAGGARQKSALIVLERGGLVEYDLGFGPAALRFAESIIAPGMRRIDTFEGNLYLLDVIGRQVWKYASSAEGYTALPEPYFDTPPAGIETAIDMAIDGNVYLLEANGSVHKYFGGAEATFSLSGLPSPIVRPVALAIDPYTPAESSVYVADAAGARIVQFAPDGRFLRQIRSPGGEFDGIEDLWVDERTGRLFVISNGQLYSATLPPVQ